MSRVAKVGLLIVALVVPTASAQPPAVEVPAAIKVPDGHKLVAKFGAQGVQVYEAVKDKAGDLKWNFEGPLAELSNAQGGKVAIHYYGPAWEAADGSKVVKPDDKKATSVKSKKPATDLPWLLIPVKSDDAKDARPGTFSSVVYIQRVATSGGMAPTDLPKRLGSKIGVPYTAVYYFWARD